eukprot:IDg15372t1
MAGISASHASFSSAALTLAAASARRTLRVSVRAALSCSIPREESVTFGASLAEETAAQGQMSAETQFFAGRQT